MFFSRVHFWSPRPQKKEQQQGYLTARRKRKSSSKSRYSQTKLGNVIVDTHGLGGMVGDTPIHVVKTYAMLVAYFCLR